MRRFVILCTLTANLLLPATSQAQWTLRPLVPQSPLISPYSRPLPYPPGSPVNPYILQSPWGESFRMHSLFPPTNPLDPGHQFSWPAPGTPTNPFIIRPLR